MQQVSGTLSSAFNRLEMAWVARLGVAVALAAPRHVRRAVAMAAAVPVALVERGAGRRGLLLPGPGPLKAGGKHFATRALSPAGRKNVLDSSQRTSRVF